MVITKFDPFEDRLCRDVRNDLSEAFAGSLAHVDMGPVKKIAEKFLDKDIGHIYRDYINERLKRYEKALNIIQTRQIEDTFARALVLWDQELFFEVHEILEHAWLKAEGKEKLVLQAMIRAAGVYVQLDHGNTKGAHKMAAKAVEGFSSNRDAVPPILNTDLLIDKLRRVDPIPPKLTD